MNIEVKRIAKKEKYTIGHLYINGVYFCDTIEDRDRGLKQTMTISEIKARKIADVTAIPAGTYRVTLNVKSPKYSKREAFAWCGGFLPRLIDVPGYDGVLIHSGNTERDSSGCIIVGKNTKVGMVTDSMNTLKALYSKLKSATSITLKIG